MDFMVAYFPAIKGIIGLLFVLVIYMNARRKRYKTALVLSLFGILFTMYSPIKIDGTRTAQHHKTTSLERSAEYDDVARNTFVITTQKKSFAERMEDETNRSDMANKRISDEIKSIHTN